MPETCAAIVIAAKHGELIKVRDYSGITDTIGALRCKFEFRTNDWDNATMTAVFCKGNMATNPEIVDGAIGVLLDSIDECAVPAEVLTRDAKYFSVGVWGVTAAGFRIVSKWLVFRVEDGCYVDATEPIEPTPTVYEQIMLSLQSKASIDHEHNDIYYTKPELNKIINNVKPDVSPELIESVELNTDARHKHKDNLDILDKFSEVDGELLYDGKSIESTGTGLTDEQLEEFEKNTEARHAHENKTVLDYFSENYAKTRPTYKSENNIIAYQIDVTDRVNALRVEMNNKLSAVPKFDIVVIDELPTENISNTTVYLVRDNETDGNLYTEYIYINNVWEKLGNYRGDLTGYIKEEDLAKELADYRKNDTPVPASEVAYSHQLLQDKSGTMKGAFDEAISFVLGVAAPSLHTHSNKNTLDNIGNLFVKNAELTKYAKTEDVYSKKEIDEKGFITLDDIPESDSGNEYVAGDLIEIKDGVIRSTLGDSLGSESVEVIDEIFSADAIPQMEVSWNNPVNYNYIFESEDALLNLPDLNKKFTIEFIKPDGSKKEFEVDLEGEEWEDGAWYEAELNCEGIEEGKEYYYAKIDETSDALYFFIDTSSGEEPYTYIHLITFEDYTGSALVVGHKTVVIKDNYVRLPDNALGAGNLIEIKDGVVSSTLGKSYTVESLKEILNMYTIPEMYYAEEHLQYNSEPISIPELPNNGDIIELDFILPNTSKPIHYTTNVFEFIVEGESFGYAACINCKLTEKIEIIKEDASLPAFVLAFQYDDGEIDNTVAIVASVDDYTGASISVGIHTTITQKITLPNEALNLDSVPIEGGIKPITSGGVYDALQNLTAEDIGALPDSVFIPTKVSELENDKDFTSFNDIMTELSEQEYAKQHWVINLLDNKQDRLLFDTEPTEGSNRPVTSGGIYAALQVDPRATMAQTVALLVENAVLPTGSMITVSLEAPDEANLETSIFAQSLFNLSGGGVTVYAPSERGTLNYLDPVTFEFVTLNVEAGGIYEFYIDMDLYETRQNSYTGTAVLAFFKSILLADINIPTKEEIVAEVLAQLPKAEESVF